VRSLRGLLPWAVVLAATPAQAQDARPAGYESVVHARPKREAARLVLTAKDLAERGVDNLAEALERIPEVQVREGGRGDTRVDLRGAKQRSVLVLIDGVPVDEPYFGAFDLASIPVTDIVEIRVVLSPASPLEGPGGDGGIVEVQTLRATGGRRVNARLRGSTLPGGQAAVTGRGDLGRGFAIRASGGGRYGAPVHQALSQTGAPGTFVDRDWQTHAALRLEWVRRELRITADAFYEHRDFYVPPTQETGSDVQHVKNENSVRSVLGVDYQLGALRLAAGAYFMQLQRDTDYYEDFTLAKFQQTEVLAAWRTGAAFLADRGFRHGHLGASLTARLSYDHEGADLATTVRDRVIVDNGFMEAAIGSRLTWKTWLRLDAAFGLAVPVRHASATWPEAKVTLTITPLAQVELQISGARKGRVPTLREEFSPIDGNPDVQPEQTSYGEVVMQTRPARWLSLRVTGYARLTQGLIRLDPIGRKQVINLDDITVFGLESRVEVFPTRLTNFGIAYLYADPFSPTLGLYPIDNFPRHRVDVWASIGAPNVGGVFARLRHVADRVDTLMPLNDYTVIDLSGWVKVLPQLRATIRVDNVFNAAYDLRRGLRALGPVATLSLEGTWE
jgi:outer membrane receptor protein involved in Fe transport